MSNSKRDTATLWKSRLRKKVELPENCRLWASQLDIVCQPHRVVVETMYSPKINENQIQRLYRLRESMKENGTKMTMTTMAREAIEQYLTEKETNEKKRKGRYLTA